ncbi:hypothetical protein [Inquilinus limosus]|uniref:hypothetical protein n=1 Tax=Inquilinus limosus TaxID=171674 RepID=UPI0012DD35AF|nr:hypothetical protein [Inquilinus limosus]
MIEDNTSVIARKKRRPNERKDGQRPKDERRQDSRPFLVIPYWSEGPTSDGDNGSIRPLPPAIQPGVVYYACPSIQTSPYVPGQPLTVTVEVGNFGGANTPSLAQVTVWWSEPTTGFVIEPGKLIGFQSIPVEPRRRSPSRPMTKVIPSDAPDHICLLARVSHQYDRAGSVADPINDRHWAQRNLSVVAVKGQLSVELDFFAGNPLKHAGNFVLEVRELSPERLRFLGEELQCKSVSSFGHARLVKNEREADNQIGVELEPAERRRVQLQVEMAQPLARGQFSAVEIIQRHGKILVGALAVAIVGE